MVTKSAAVVALPSKEIMIQQLSEHSLSYGAFGGKFDRIYNDYIGSIANSQKTAKDLATAWKMTIDDYTGMFHPLDLVNVSMKFGEIVEVIAPKIAEQAVMIRFADL